MELFRGNIAEIHKNEKIFDKLACLAAEIFSVPISAISLRLADRHLLIGEHGLGLREVSKTFDLGEFADAPLWYEDILRESDARLAPLIKPDPDPRRQIRFFACAPIVNRRFRRVGLVEVQDYIPRSPDKRLAETLEIIANIVDDMLYRPHQSAYGRLAIDSSPLRLVQPGASGAGEFSEEPAGPEKDKYSIAEKFLLDTLIKRPAIKTRNKVSYLSLRAWRKSIKKHQIAALREIKAAPTPDFIEAVSEETASGIDRLVGTHPVRIVTHVPCGHSRKEKCLSRRVAERIAADFGLPVVSAFKENFSSGSSHPKANLVRPAMEIHTRIVDPVLIVDDVASSGRHIEEAVGLLRQTTNVVVPVAWIGGQISAPRRIVSRLARAARI